MTIWNIPFNAVENTSFRLLAGYVAVALHHEMRFEYFENEWHDKPDWIAKAKSKTTELWERDYEGDGLHPEARVAPGTTDFDVPGIFSNAFFLLMVPHWH